MTTSCTIWTKPSSPDLRRLRAAASVAVLLILAAAPARAQDGARAVVEAMTTKVLDVLKQRELPAEQKRAQIEQVVYQYIDFDTTSRLILARNWQQLSDAQKREFVDEFKKHLSLTYGRGVDNYKNERIEVLEERKESNGDVTVKTRILRGGDDIMVDYRLRQKDGQWKIIDVIIERVSLVASFRSQFQEVMNRGGADEVIRMLRDKNARGEPSEAAPGAREAAGGAQR